MRYTAAFSFVFGTALCLHALPLRPGVAAANPDSGMRFLQLSSGILVFLLIPAMYVTARCRYDAIRVAELRDQSRLGEARFLLVRVLALDRDCRCNGQPVRRDLPDLNSSLRALEARVANEMSESATIIERTERARELAIMGLTDKASEVLLASDECETNPEACGLLATISEHRGDWETALSKYLKCLELWRSIPDDNRRKEGIHAATMGTAVCYRKLGRIRQAKEAWLSLLDISPTAETHFLLAQFFEDIQDTARAHEHARKAMEISPSRYSEKCQALISKMQTLHFGCFGVYRSATTDQSHHEKSSAVPPTLKR